MTLEHAAGDDVEAGRHLLEGMADHVAEEEVVVAARGEARHKRSEAAMDRGEQAVAGDSLPERLQRIVVEGEPLVAFGPEAHALQSKPRDVADLAGRRLGALQGNDADGRELA